MMCQNVSVLEARAAISSSDKLPMDMKEVFGYAGMR